MIKRWPFCDVYRINQRTKGPENRQMNLEDTLYRIIRKTIQNLTNIMAYWIEKECHYSHGVHVYVIVQHIYRRASFQFLYI